MLPLNDGVDRAHVSQDMREIFSGSGPDHPCALGRRRKSIAREGDDGVIAPRAKTIRKCGAHAGAIGHHEPVLCRSVE